MVILFEAFNYGIGWGEIFELNRMCGAWMPSKLKLFGRRLLLNALPTRSELCKRGMKHVLNGSLCPLCGVNEESVSHLFFGCIHVGALVEGVSLVESGFLR